MENSVGRFWYYKFGGSVLSYNKKGGQVRKTNNFILATTVFIISEPADAHEEKKRHSNKIESCGSAAVKTGKGRIMSPLRVGGAGALA